MICDIFDTKFPYSVQLDLIGWNGFSEEKNSSNLEYFSAPHKGAHTIQWKVWNHYTWKLLYSSAGKMEIEQVFFLKKVALSL